MELTNASEKQGPQTVLEKNSESKTKYNDSGELVKSDHVSLFESKMEL